MSEKQITAPSRNDDSSLAALIERPEYKNRFNDVLGFRAPQFLSSVLSLHMHTMRDVDPKSILAAAMTAASLDLPINPNLGFAYIIAYADKNRGGQKYAQFQMGYKGFVQLAMRTGKYRFLNACVVYDGEFIKYNKLTGELVLDDQKRKSDTVIGYASHFQLINGFEHSLYMAIEDVAKHGKKYSQSFRKGYGLWCDDFESMALKTVLKLNLSKWGMLSVQMERAFYEDQAIKTDINADPKYIDNDPETIPTAQIADRAAAPEISGDKQASEPAETPAPAAEVAQEATEVAPTTDKPARKKAADKKAASKPSLSVQQPETQPESEPTPTVATTEGKEEAQPGGPHAGVLIAKLNEKGVLLKDFLVLAFYQHWLKPPDDYSGEIGDLDLATFVIPKEKAEEFVQADNIGLILDLLAKPD